MTPPNLNGGPLTPEERAALRRMLAHETEIVDAAESLSHLGWTARFILTVAKWVGAVIGAVILWNSLRYGGMK